ncbi:MAG: hypothetical protein MRY74_09385 [Neomegalonema sp.]|nr:hypothetical protein [Neomegalonema sp.]
MRTHISASIYRGGTSNAVFFKASDLPENRSLWADIFLHIMGSPDIYGRQLDGLGGGLSSLSKVVVVSPSDREGADLDYMFFQISVDRPIVDEGAMCGNMAASVGPFAVEHDLIGAPADGPVQFRVRNTNTNKLFEVEFDMSAGQVVETGEFSIPGVSGTGARIGLRFLDPAGSRSKALLPTGQAIDRLSLASGETVEASLVDATNPVVFMRADAFGLKGDEPVDAIESDRDLMQKLEELRRAGSVAMGLSDDLRTAKHANPKIALVASPREFVASNGQTFEQSDMDASIRMLSMEKVHRAVTLTGGMCLAAALSLPEFVLSTDCSSKDVIRIAHPAGVFPVIVDGDFAGHPEVRSLTCYRTQRRLMEGSVPVPNHLLRRSH